MGREQSQPKPSAKVQRNRSHKTSRKIPVYAKANPNKRYPKQGHTHTQKNAATITPARPRPKTGCIPAAAPVEGEEDALAEDEVPEWVLPVEVVLVPVWVPVAVVAVVVCLMLPVVTVVFNATDEISTADDGGGTGGKLVLMTETTAG